MPYNILTASLQNVLLLLAVVAVVEELSSPTQFLGWEGDPDHKLQYYYQSLGWEWGLDHKLQYYYQSLGWEGVQIINYSTITNPWDGSGV